VAAKRNGDGIDERQYYELLDDFITRNLKSLEVMERL
jgi:hypothetical protein